MIRYFSYLVVATMIFSAALTSCNDENHRGFSVTVSSEKNGTASANVTSAVEGELITLTATANSGYRFVEWQVIEDGITLSSATDNPATFIMPDKAVEVKAIFVQYEWLPDAILLNNSIKYVYEYDNQNRIAKCMIYVSYSDGVWYFDSEHTLDYNVDGDLVMYDVGGYYGAPHTGFTTNGNNITFSRSHKITQQVSRTENGKLELNEQGLPVRLTSESKISQPYNGTNTSFYTFSLTWQNGNLTKTDWELVQTDWEGKYKGSRNGTNTYTYDDKKALFYRCNTPKWFLWWLDYYDKYDFSSHNENYGYNENSIKTETSENGSSITYEYTYNDYGFPVTRTWISGTTTYTETYTYK